MNNTTTETTPKKSNRAPYGFELNFPTTFTLKDLRKAKSHKVKYITLYMRVKKALANGEIVISGEKTPKTKRRGARELVYTRVNATRAVDTLTASEPVAVASGEGW